MAIIIHLVQPTRRGEKSVTWVGQWRDERGRLHKKTTGTRNKSVARTIVREWERRMALGEQGITDWEEHKGKLWSATVDEYVEKHARRPDTLDLYRRMKKQFMLLMGDPPLWQITTSLIEDFAAQRVTKVSATTVNKELRHARSVLRWAAKRLYLRKVPDFSSVFIREDRKEPVNVPVETYNRLLAALPKVQFEHRSFDWWRIWLEVGWGLGLRRGELLGLRWADVDWNSATIKVSCVTSKSRKDRRLPLMDNLVARLREWRKGNVGMGSAVGTRSAAAL